MRRPDWAASWDDDDWDRFVGLVRDHLVERGAAARVVDGAVLLDDRPAIGLASLARTCRTLEQEDWRPTVADRLDQLLDGPTREVPTTFAEAAPRLRVRLYADDGRLGPEAAVTRPAAEGLSWTLVADAGDVLATVLPEEAAAWGRAEDELFDVAFGNVRAETPDVAVERRGGLAITSVTGDSVYTSTHVRWLDQHVRVPPAGALVILPTRHAVHAYALDGPQAVDAPEVLIEMAGERSAEGPGELTADLFWWRAGDLLRLRVHEADGRPTLELPERLDELFAELRSDR